MKIFLEADFSKGNGALRWEGVTNRRITKFIVAITTVAAAVAFAIIHRI